MPELSLIVPTFNEADNLPSLARRVDAALIGCSYQLIVVDDDSPDGTSQVAEKLAEKYPIKVINRKGEKGLASAVVEGLRKADGDFLGVIDGDLQHPPEHIPLLLEEARRGADIVVASRYCQGGGTIGWTFSRKIMSRFASLLGQVALGSARMTSDPLSGFFLLKRKVIQGVELKPIGYKILLEVLARGNAEKVSSVPYVFHERMSGQSKLGLREQFDYLRHLKALVSDDAETLRVLKFLIVGTVGVGINLGVLWTLIEILNVAPFLAEGIAIEAAVLSNFAINDTWTFRDRNDERPSFILGRLLRFNVVSFVGLGINLGVFWLSTSLLDLFYPLAAMAGIGIAAIWNFAMSTAWTWRKKRNVHHGTYAQESSLVTDTMPERYP